MTAKDKVQDLKIDKRLLLMKCMNYEKELVLRDRFLLTWNQVILI